MSGRPRWLTGGARSGQVLDKAPGARPAPRRTARAGKSTRRKGQPGGGRGRRSGVDRSKARFERRAAAVRRRPRTVLAVVSALVVLVGVLVWLVGFSSVLATRTVTVTGLADAAEQQAVAEAAAVQIGTPLARVDAGGAAERVARIPTIASVSVNRSWPTTVVVSVQRKVPVLAVKNPQGQLQVVDASGMPFETVTTLPPGVAEVNAASDSPDPQGVQAAISVLELLSPERRAQVSGVTVTSADLVTLQLGKVSVVWGGLADGPKKLAILEVLLKTNPAVVDVSAPDTPITR
jgi:cell division protein FtsQ